MRPIIKSIKHIVQFTAQTVASGAVSSQGIANAESAPAVSNTFDVNIGCNIKAVYAEIWLDGDSSEFNYTAVIVKRPAGIAAPTLSQMATLMAYNNKNNILEMHQALPPDNGNIIPLFRGWIKIPKGKQRFAQGDKLTFTIAAVGTEIHYCGFFIYKEYQ